nr:regulatory protein RecX [Psychrobacter sp. PraFG1]UNK06593.1 recombination regulator RecX [Psychrobacter sp. PraFG1]
MEALLQEFKDKGYQSDHRTALMLIREGIRKGRGRVRIKNDFYKRKVEVPANIDELIDMAMADNEEFVDVLSDNTLVECVDWLRLAVEARVKKYGDEIPTDQKIKARQLRFLQYRGFKPGICFEAIKYNLQTLDERF